MCSLFFGGCGSLASLSTTGSSLSTTGSDVTQADFHADAQVGNQQNFWFQGPPDASAKFARPRALAAWATPSCAEGPVSTWRPGNARAAAPATTATWTMWRRLRSWTRGAFGGGEKEFVLPKQLRGAFGGSARSNAK